jgi:dolichol-phosphate mannosyltransferase
VDLRLSRGRAQPWSAEVILARPVLYDRDGVTPRYSFVVPIYNEEETLPELERRLRGVLDKLDGEAEVILVDDGSSDRSPELLDDLHRRDARFKVVRLTRNFGHQIAITAGLDCAAGDATIIMDGDLQDPPELAHELIERWREGYEVVYAIRVDRTSEPFLRRSATRLFYRVLHRLSDVDLPLAVGDFRLVDRRALDEFRRLRESNRYVRGLFAWLGFRHVGVPYKREARYAGRSKYPLRKAVTLGVDGLVGFSRLPLNIAMILGFVVSAGAFLLGLVAIGLRVAHVQIVPGWASVIVVMSFLGGVQLIVTGMMGVYVGRVFDEVKARPLYIVRETEGYESEQVSARPTAGGPGGQTVLP